MASGWLAASFGRRLRRAWEAEREAKRIAEAAVAARQDLMGMVAHDLRNPLSAITLKSHLIVQGLPEGSRLHAHAMALERVADRMRFLITSLLDAASIEAGALKLERHRCETQPLLDATLELFQEQAARRGIALVRGDGDPSLEVLGDHDRLLQVLSNLVGNALKFTPSDGSIRLACRSLAGVALFEGADTGPGVPQEDQARIFDRYWKHDAVHHRGTGLGLFIARWIVESHGGRIWVESGFGTGARFMFTVPLAEASAPAGGQRPAIGSAAAAPPSPPRGNEG